MLSQVMDLGFYAADLHGTKTANFLVNTSDIFEEEKISGITISSSKRTRSTYMPTQEVSDHKAKMQISAVYEHTG